MSIESFPPGSPGIYNVTEPEVRKSRGQDYMLKSNDLDDKIIHDQTSRQKTS